jgi:hypothetical protein
LKAVATSVSDLLQLSIDPFRPPPPPPRRWPPKHWKLWLTVSSPFLLAAIGLAYYSYAKWQYVPAAVAETVLFHQWFEAEKDADIYWTADPAWRRAVSEEVQHAFFNRIRRKMGACRYSGPLGWTLTFTPAGTVLVMGGRADCEHDSLQEVFTWRMTARGRPMLVSYQANSPLRLTD